MTTLKNLKGTAIQFLDADPVVYAGSWSSAGALNTDRAYSGGSGIATSGVIFGGYTTPGAYVANTETYNGTSFTEVNDLNNTRGAGAYAGATQSNAIAISGTNPSPGYMVYVEKWDGTNWTETGDVNVGRYRGSAAGTNTATIFFGGQTTPPSTVRVDSNESFNGTSWTEVNNLNTAKGQMAGSGTSTAAFAIAGSPNGSANLATVEQWNGTSWTETTDINTARRGLGGSSGAGSVTATLIFGGYEGSHSAKTESWNGSAWTEIADMATARSDFAGTGTTTSALASGGEPNYGATEQWSFPPATASTLQEGDMWFNSSSSVLKGYGTAAGIPAATWSAGGTMNTGREAGGGSGAQTAAIVFGGQDPKRAQTETYDGTSFTEVNDMNTARSTLGNAGQGSQTATLAFGGIEPALSAKTESWDGTSWTEVNDLNAARGYVSGFGTQTAAICANGYPPDTANVESWNGTSWTEVNNTPYAYSSAAGSGTQTAGLVFGGYYPPVGYNTASFEFDGTNWTSGGTMNTGRSNLEGAGLQTDTLIFGGATAPIVAKSESYDGTSFTEVADLSTAISNSMPGGTSGTAVLSAGGAPGNPTASEEFTADAAVVTVTTS